MEKELEAVGKLIDTVLEFSVAYGFQILGALVFLLIGLKVSGWAGRKVADLTQAKEVDPALARFMGNVVKLVLIGFVIIATLGNFGISIAPLIALAGASAFGATIALQGPLSNYGAGLAIMLGRPFGVGNTITVNKISGVVDDITLAATVLVGEDGERITIPNKEVVGQVIVNSKDNRVVETRIAVGADEDIDRAIETLRDTVSNNDQIVSEPAPQIGVHDFTLGGVVIGLRFWVPSTRYFQVRYAVNRQLMSALRDAGIGLMSAAPMAVPAPALSADGEGPPEVHSQ